MNIRKMKRMAVSLLLITSIAGGLLSPAANVSAAVSDTVANNSSTADNDESKAEMLCGGLYDMGYEFNIEPKLMTGTVLKVRAVCEENKTIVETQTSTGYYELKLTEGRKYHVTFWAYISGRLKNLNCDMDDVVCGTEINFAVRTNTVPGLAELNKYLDKMPDNCVVVRGNDTDDPSATLSYDKWQETVLKLSTNTISFDISPKSRLTQQYVKPETEFEDAIYTYESGYTFSSSNKAAAEVNENGCVTAVAKGKAEISCTIEAAQKSAVCKVDVKGGFDYSKDGYCFENDKDAFYYDAYLSGKTVYYPYERFEEVYGNTYTRNQYNFFVKKLRKFVSFFDPNSNIVQWEKERKFGGNCFGMSLSAILFYNGLLDVEDYKTEKYDAGESVNEGLYDWLTWKSKYGCFCPALNRDYEKCELTKMIERYQIWQNQEWKEKNEVLLEEVLENWDSGKTYLLSFRHGKKECGCDGVNYGHAVVVDTHGEKPKQDENGNYELPIYDPNYPAFTDDIADGITGDILVDGMRDKINGKDAEQRFITVTVAESEAVRDTGLYSTAGATADAAQNDEKEKHVIRNLRYIDVSDAPVDFEEPYNYTALQKDTCSLKAPKTADITIKGTETNTVYLLVKNGEVVYENPSVICEQYDEDHNSEYWIYGIKEAWKSEIIDNSSNKRSSESTDATAVNRVSDGAVQAASFDGAGTVSMTPNNEMQIHTESKSTVNLLTEKHASDGSIVSVAGELQSGAGNDITCTLDENDQFLLQSSEKTEAILTLNTEETGFEQKAVISVDGNSEKVDILDYMEKNKTDNPTIGGPGSSEDKKDDENNSSGTNSPKKGTLVTDKATKAVYKITGTGNNKRTVQYIKSVSRQIKSAKIPAYITYKGIKYNVTSIASNAFKGNKKLTKVTIGKNVLSIGNKAFYKCIALTKITIPVNVQKIGKQAFYGDKALKSITIKTKKLTTKKVGSQAFKGISNKAVIRIPKNKLKTYPKLLKTKGAGKKVTFKK